MKRLFVPVFALLVCLAAIGSEALAGIVWIADWSPGTPTVVSDSGKNQVNFTNQPSITLEGNSDLTAANLSLAKVVGPSDTFTSQNYSLKLKLTDKASGEFKEFQFAGSLTGTVTGADDGIAASVNIDNEFKAPESITLQIGDNDYTVTIGPYAPVAPPGGIPGAISAHIDVTPHNGEEPPNETPEPTSLVLAGLGVAGLGMRAWRKRKLFTA